MTKVGGHAASVAPKPRHPSSSCPGCRIPSVVLCQRAAWSWRTPGSRSPAPLDVVAEQPVTCLSSRRRGSPLAGRGSTQPSSAAVLGAPLKEAGQRSGTFLYESCCLVRTAKYADNNNDKAALRARSHPCARRRRTLQRDYSSGAAHLCRTGVQSRHLCSCSECC